MTFLPDKQDFLVGRFSRGHGACYGSEIVLSESGHNFSRSWPANEEQAAGPS
jgi:hypothetical protein